MLKIVVYGFNTFVDTKLFSVDTRFINYNLS